MNRWPIKGVEVWKNEKNQFFVFQAHYSANPAKDTPEYKNTMKSAMPIRQYMQEFELQWESYEGTPVYPDFSRQLHGSKEPIDPVFGLPLLRGWDFGLTPACVVGQYVDGQLRILREFVAYNKGAEQFSTEVLRQMAVLYPGWADPKRDWRDAIDPAGEQRKDTDMSTCAKVLITKGLTPFPGPVAWEPRRRSVEQFLVTISNKQPAFLIDMANCPVLVRGFEGGYRYPEKSLEIEPHKIRPLKDEHSHPHDALQYLCAKLKDWTRIKQSTVPSPEYFAGRSHKSLGMNYGVSKV